MLNLLFCGCRLWEGHATIVEEIAADLAREGRPPPATIICSVGGGGLLAGILQGIRAQGPAWADVEVIAAETEGADSFAQVIYAMFAPRQVNVCRP